MTVTITDRAGLAATLRQLRFADGPQADASYYRL